MLAKAIYDWSGFLIWDICGVAIQPALDSKLIIHSVCPQHVCWTVTCPLLCVVQAYTVYFLWADSRHFYMCVHCLRVCWNMCTIVVPTLFKSYQLIDAGWSQSIGECPWLWSAVIICSLWFLMNCWTKFSFYCSLVYVKYWFYKF